MHSLSNELLNVKIIHLGNKAIMDRKREKLLKLSKPELVQVATEVRVELNQPWITDVLSSDSDNSVCMSNKSSTISYYKECKRYDKPVGRK